MCPISNRDIEVAHKFHAATKHSCWSVRLGSHFLDWERKPLPCKVHPTLPAITFLRHIAPPAAEGTTFFDDVTERLSPYAAGKATLFAVALGQSVRVSGRVKLLGPWTG